MGSHDIERKLAAIMSADVKGYSRLMGEDEVATIRTLTRYRAVMATLIRQHRGRVVDSRGITCWPSLPASWMQCNARSRFNKS